MRGDGGAGESTSRSRSRKTVETIWRIEWVPVKAGVRGMYSTFIVVAVQASRVSRSRKVAQLTKKYFH